MQPILLFLGLASTALAANIFERQQCNADNCLRGIRGTGVNIQPPLSSRLADCSSFQRATVTPAATTITETVATVTITVSAGTLAARQETVVPTAIPAYATYCPSAPRYASACSCIGVTATTTTLSTPTITVPYTATATVTSVPVSYSCTPADSASACGGDCDGTCFPDVSGNGFCKQSRPCDGLAACVAGSDCASGICLVNGCGSVCAETQYLCPNTTSAKFLFRKTPFAAGVEEEKIVL